MDILRARVCLSVSVWLLFRPFPMWKWGVHSYLLFGESGMYLLGGLQTNKAMEGIWQGLIPPSSTRRGAILLLPQAPNNPLLSPHFGTGSCLHLFTCQNRIDQASKVGKERHCVKYDFGGGGCVLGKRNCVCQGQRVTVLWLASI